MSETGKSQPAAIEMRADKWHRPWILAAWPVMALCAPQLLNSDNPRILVGDGLATFRCENGTATYKIGAPEFEGGPLVLELLEGSTFVEPPAPGAEPEPIGDDATLEAMPDDILAQTLHDYGLVTAGAREGDIAALKHRRDGTEPPAPGAAQPEKLPTDQQQPKPVAEDAEVDRGDQYFGPEIGEEVAHHGQKKTVMGTKFTAGKGSFVAFDESGNFVAVDDCQPLDSLTE